MTQVVARMVTDSGWATSALQVLPDRDNPNVFVFLTITVIAAIFRDGAGTGTPSAFDLIVRHGIDCRLRHPSRLLEHFGSWFLQVHSDFEESHSEIPQTLNPPQRHLVKTNER